MIDSCTINKVRSRKWLIRKYLQEISVWNLSLRLSRLQSRKGKRLSTGICRSSRIWVDDLRSVVRYLIATTRPSCPLEQNLLRVSWWPLHGSDTIRAWAVASLLDHGTEYQPLCPRKRRWLSRECLSSVAVQGSRVSAACLWSDWLFLSKVKACHIGARQQPSSSRQSGSTCSIITNHFICLRSYP